MKMPPITLEQRARVRELRERQGRSWAYIAHVMARREATLRDWYERDRADELLKTVR